MAIAMAGTLAASLRTLPGAAWVAIFAMLTCWFGYRVARDAPPPTVVRAPRPGGTPRRTSCTAGR